MDDRSSEDLRVAAAQISALTAVPRKALRHTQSSSYCSQSVVSIGTKLVMRESVHRHLLPTFRMDGATSPLLLRLHDKILRQMYIHIFPYPLQRCMCVFCSSPIRRVAGIWKLFILPFSPSACHLFCFCLNILF